MQPQTITMLKQASYGFFTGIIVTIFHERTYGRREAAVTHVTAGSQYQDPSSSVEYY